MALRPVVLAAVIIGALGCGSSTAPHAKPTIGIAFVRGNNQTDTVGAALTQALNIHVTSAVASQTVAGQVVQFVAIQDSLTTGPDSGQQVYEAQPEALTSNFPQPFIAESLDADGSASVVVVLGPKSGTARLAVKVPSLGFTDTAQFTVKPGNLTTISVSPADTAIVNGSSLTLKASTVDRFGNPRADPVQIAIKSGPATVSGKTVTATGIGRITIITTNAQRADTTHMTAVPSGTLAASNRNGGIATFNFDGSNYKLISVHQFAGNIKWSPSGTSLVFDQSSGCDAQSNLIQTTDLQGNVKPIDHGSAYDQYPSYSRDGTWIYWASNTGGSSALWRAHPDGTNDASLTTLNPGFDIYPSPSPNGQQVAYVELASGHLRLLTVSTGAVTDLGVSGWSPEWSPTSNQIAYVTAFCSGHINIVNSDGTGVHSLTSGTYLTSFDWSPDGKWIVAFNTTTSLVDLINTTSGVALPLPFTNSLYSPTWKP
jgi:WD40-like Beta Propeller Repeat